MRKKIAKTLFLVAILLASASIAPGSSRVRRITAWLCKQNYNRTQLQSVTWPQMETMAENRGIDPNSIKPYRRTILNAVWSDWRQKRLETARTILETKVRQYDPDGIVLYMGYERSLVDPNNMVSIFSVEVDLNLERN